MGAMPKLVGAAIAAASLVLTLSGCFLFGQMKWDPAVVKAGKKTKAVISFVPETSDVGVIDRMVPFVLVGLDDGGILELKGVRKFDVKRNFGGPYPMFADGTMETEAISTPDCGIGSGTLNEIPGVEWTLLRTDDDVNDRDKTKAAIAKIVIEVAAAAENGQAPAYVFTGNWSDQGPNPGQIDEDEVQCSGGAISNITVKG